METTPKTKEEVQAKINQLKEDGVADEKVFTKEVDDLTQKENGLQSEINKLKNPTEKTNEEIAANLGIPAELPGLAEAQAELDIEKQKKEFMALVQEFNTMKASYEAKMARIAELDKIIEENKNNQGTVVTNEVAEPVNQETNLEDLSDEELARREQELEKEIVKNNTQETQDIEKYHVILGNGNFTVRIKNWEEIKEGKKNISTEDPDGVWLVTGEDGSIIADNVGGKEAEEIYNKAVEEFAATYKKNDIKRRRQEELNNARTDSRFSTREEEDAFHKERSERIADIENIKKEINEANSPEEVKKINKKYDELEKLRTKRISSPFESEEGKAIVKAEIDKINAKYDAELAALENDKPASENAEVENYEKPFIPEGEHSFTPDKTSHINEKGEEFKLGDEVYQTPAQGNKPIYEYLGKVTGFSNEYAFTTLNNSSTDKRPTNTDVLVKKVPDGMEIIGK